MHQCHANNCFLLPEGQLTCSSLRNMETKRSLPAIPKHRTHWRWGQRTQLVPNSYKSLSVALIH